MLSKLTLQAWLWITAVLLAAALASTLAAYAEHANAKSARADVKSVAAERDDVKRQLGTARDERDDALAAIDTWKRLVEVLEGKLKFANAENDRVRREGDEALARAQAGKRDAERTLSEFTARYASALRAPNCNAALNALEAACPELSRY